MQRSDKTTKPQGSHEPLHDAARQALGALENVLAASGRAQLSAGEVGRVVSVGPGVARVRGLPSVQAEELVSLHGGLLGLA